MLVVSMVRLPKQPPLALRISPPAAATGFMTEKVRRGPFSMCLTGKKVPRRVLRRGSEKGVSRRCLERPLGEQDPLGVAPIPKRLLTFANSPDVTTESNYITVTSH